MLKIWFCSLASVLIISLVSLVGVFSLYFKKERLGGILLFLVSFAVGGLLGDSFIHLLPETFENLGINIVSSLLILSGMFLFFILEKFIRWRHCHVPTSREHVHPVAFLNLVGDAVHNFIDGMVVAASFIVSIPIGITTALAVLLHEIPQEIGDFGILIHSGMPVKKALAFNFLSALTALLGVAFELAVESRIKGFSNYLIPITAGGFLYIASSDLIPQLHRDHEAKLSTSFLQLISIVLGVGVMTLLVFIE